MKISLPQLCRAIVFLFLTQYSISAQATHIVGGELELQHVGNDLYQLGLILYFDNISGLEGARDPSATIYIYSKSTNDLIRQYTMPRISVSRVEYTSPECAVGYLSTDKLYYSTQVRLSASIFNDPKGYYAVYERCCRNGSVQNIVDPGGAGQAFYMEFPAVVKDGEPFVNSTPKLFPPLSDYACINQPFQFDFSGTDADGDSLVYSLVTPLNGHSSRDEPVPNFPQSGPYETVTFLSNYDSTKMIPGNPALRIGKHTGFLEVTPSETGLFVFSVKCEEYRDGVKIGEVLRDFQMMVLDCKEANAPTVFAETTSGEILITTDTLVFEPGRLDNCINFYVTDPDDLTTLTTIINPIGFDDNDFIITSDQTGITNGGDTIMYSICLDECPIIKNQPYEIQIITADNSCSLPLRDTMSVYVLVPEPNTPPDIFSDDIVFNEATGCYSAEVNTDEEISFEVIGTDPDGDPVKLSLIGNGFNPDEEGMYFSADSALAKVTSTFSWMPSCSNLPVDAEEAVFNLQFVVGDIGVCGTKATDTICVDLKVISNPPPNNAPELSADKDLRMVEEGVFYDTVRVGEEYILNLESYDIDSDSIRLVGEVEGYDFSDLNIFFGNISGFGLVRSRFYWRPTCHNIADVENGSTSEVFEFDFVTRDYKDCNNSEGDSIKLFLVLIYEVTEEDAPAINVAGAQYNEAEKTFDVTIESGKLLELDIEGQDETKDLLTLRLNALNFDSEAVNMLFSNTSGVSPVTTTLIWEPLCDYFNDSIDNTYLVEMVVSNVSDCGIAAADTINLRITLTDVQREAVEDFPNAFSPDGNNVNDEFEILVLPPDLCNDMFEYIEITNRWGDVVFYDENRDFKWDGGDSPEGVYYYRIKYTKTQYKGLINLFKITE
ncbi:MAG: hypothetical protein CMO01_12570 [Thalassobius sp.]|nr:hypothetical protein [Thalassovita sp.]